MSTVWKSHSCRCQPVPSCGGISALALTRWQTTWPPVASAMPRSRYRKKSRKPPPVNSVSPGLTWENSLTTACRFIMASIVLVDAIAAIPRASNFLAARDFASPASLCYAKIAPAGLHRGDFDGGYSEYAEAAGAIPKSELRDFVRVIIGAGGADDVSAPDGTKLSNACPMLEPFKQAAGRPRCLIFDLELLDVGRLGFGGLDPFLHLGHRHDHTGISRQSRLQLHVIGQQSGHDRRIHGVRHGAFAEQERPARFAQAFLPDSADPIDIGLRARPDLEAGKMTFQVDRQRRAQGGEPRMDFAANRPAMRPRNAVRRQQARVRPDLVEIFSNRQRIPYGGALVA